MPKIIPSGDALGAEVLGVDLSKPLDDETFLAVESAFNEHSVICIRNQDLIRRHLSLMPIIMVNPKIYT